MSVSHKPKRLIWFLILALCTSCSGTSIERKLANRGPLRLDETNAFVASNRFLADKIKSSNAARGFIRNEGTPDAISIKKTFWGPFKTHLFYLEQRKAFLLEESSGETIIRGPAKIPDLLFRNLAKIPPLKKEATLVLKSGGVPIPIKAEVFETDPSLKRNHSYKKPAKTQTINYYQRASLAQKPRLINRSNFPGAPQAIHFEPNPKQATASSSPLIPSKPAKTGLSHKVKNPNESLWSIAKQYTGKGTNYKKLAKINRLQNPSKLKIGQEIHIPGKMLTNTKD